ncbi:XRE family transcriptional regulator (plasmid) [Rhizobium sp. CB3171]|uniref:ImmA/IrrE family metallo-endopeptidase n=1 Tax=Rhizobium sp. CB3171 TaxID=3039157 RepID=UPI0024B1E2A0|nr:XRE family transcriptional regulator [Rhizobium sp. CB3171]WFU04571.1 XRE family transcriptional regulator [Rhizobium sp. CB3171]
MSVEMNDIFGKEAHGTSPEDFAANSSNVYVRSQVQIALATPEAKGRRLSALEAFRAYGLDTLRAVAYEGYAPLVISKNEPANTLKRRRIELGLEIKDVAKASGLDPEVIKNIETGGKSSKIREIERLSVCLALDERIVGYVRNAGDPDLGVRLRELKADRDTVRFDPSSVLKLAEAGWIIARHNELAAMLKIDVHPIVSKGLLRTSDYRFRTAERGYELASKTRHVLGLSSNEPIASVRDLIERELGIPLVQDKLSTRFAGATIANGEVRGIVVNEEGQNEKATVRRMTLAHEIGHLVGDPDEHLNRLRVDTYDTLGGNPQSVTDPVERRANGFAVAFLAPPSAVREIADKFGDATRSVDAIVNTYGISKTAASNHLENITGLKISTYDLRYIKETTDWTPGENLTLDYFSIADTPLRKRGRFASLVVKAQRAGHISEDTAAGWLGTSVDRYKAGSEGILALQD